MNVNPVVHRTFSIERTYGWWGETPPFRAPVFVHRQAAGPLPSRGAAGPLVAGRPGPSSRARSARQCRLGDPRRAGLWRRGGRRARAPSAGAPRTRHPRGRPPAPRQAPRARKADDRKKNGASDRLDLCRADPQRLPRTVHSMPQGDAPYLGVNLPGGENVSEILEGSDPARRRYQRLQARDTRP